jgi:uncharacterized membrane protein YozB (DUF420 family)
MITGSNLDIFLSITMACVFALVAGAVVLIRRGNERKRATLMIVAALVLFANVLIWAWP